MAQVRVYGIPIQETNARKLISDLTKADTPAALTAAKQISYGLQERDSAGPLTPAMRDAIFAVLPTSPPEGLKHLHQVLQQDRDARRDD